MPGIAQRENITQSLDKATQKMRLFTLHTFNVHVVAVLFGHLVFSTSDILFTEAVR